MSDAPRISLEQWRALIAVVESGGHAQGARALHKSQSSVTYALKQLQSLLGVQLFEIRGRKGVLTPTGELFYHRARIIVEEATGTERQAKRLSAGWEAEISIAVEVLFPSWLLFKALARFGAESPHTHVEVYESVMGGTREALEQGRVDLALAPEIPPGFESRQLMRLRFVPVAHPSHPLFALGRELTMRDLRRHRLIVVRDTSTKRDKRATMEAEQRWTLGHLATSILAVAHGHGFAWYPEIKIRDELAAGMLRPLPMAGGGEKFRDIYLIYRDRQLAGPGARRLGDIIAELVDEEAGSAATAEVARGPQALDEPRTRRSREPSPPTSGASLSSPPSAAAPSLTLNARSPATVRRRSASRSSRSR